METKCITFNDESVLDYCNIMGYHYYEEVPVQYLLSILRKFDSFKPLMSRKNKLKQIKSEFEQSERIMALEQYNAALECLDKKTTAGITVYKFQMKLFKNHKVIAKIVAEFSISS